MHLLKIAEWLACQILDLLVAHSNPAVINSHLLRPTKPFNLSGSINKHHLWLGSKPFRALVTLCGASE